jgi:hypothetical protein
MATPRSAPMTPIAAAAPVERPEDLEEDVTMARDVFAASEDPVPEGVDDTVPMGVIVAAFETVCAAFVVVWLAVVLVELLLPTVAVLNIARWIAIVVPAAGCVSQP